MSNKSNKTNFFWDFIFSKDDQSEEISQIEFLKSTTFFKRLHKHQLKEVVKIMHSRTYTEGEYLFEYGNPGAALFFIQSGEVSIEIPKDGQLNQVAVLGDNTFLGELALLNSDERTASAKANKTTKCLALYRNDLIEMLASNPQIASEIYCSLAQVVGKRLVETTKTISDFKSTIESYEDELSKHDIKAPIKVHKNAA